MQSAVKSLLLLTLVSAVLGHHYVKPPHCPDDHIFYDRSPDYDDLDILPVMSEDACAEICDNVPDCVAYNIERRDELECNLNDERAGQSGENLVKAIGWSYWEKQSDSASYHSCDGVEFAEDFQAGHQMEMLDSGNPELIVHRGHARAWWGKDTVYDDGRVYHSYNDWNDALHIYEFSSEENFVNNHQSIRHDINPHGISSDYVVYKRQFWYRQSDDKEVMVWDFDQGKIVGNVTEMYGYKWFSGPHSSQCQTDRAQHTGLDIEVDESGMWFIFGLNGYNCWTVVAKIDTENFQISWHRVYPFNHAEIGGGFMADGIYYTTDHYNANPTWIRYQLNVRNDTWTSRNRAEPATRWAIPDGIQAQVHYNPIDKNVYATNNARNYRYHDIVWQKNYE